MRVRSQVKPDSRAEKAGIRPGDRLLRINDIDSAQLTIQQAHDIIKESGIHLRLAVTADQTVTAVHGSRNTRRVTSVSPASCKEIGYRVRGHRVDGREEGNPEDLEDSYHCWEDPIEDDYDSEEERRIEEEKARRRIVRCRTNKAWNLQWPWVSKRRIIYKESNCYLVPSKYETKHSDKLLPRLQDSIDTENIVLYSTASEKNEIPDKQPENDVKKPEKFYNGSTDNGIIKNGSIKNDMGTAVGDLSRIKEEPEEDTSVSDGGVFGEMLQNSDELSKEDEDRIIEDILESNDNSVNTNGETLEEDKT
ncbi:hypothetical protein EVAR_87362_1 [Eumeta japonica]|uniref:PDZ domain-containing protein n=1 Tax=Eumeta variegata TaxID=151549 RepID=A0A4C1Y128_EUMVA|nr:hypothetical protein EVAR_87362_1 [Eumeta japonica]